MYRRSNAAALLRPAAGRHAAAPKATSWDAICRKRAPAGWPDAGDAARTTGAGTRAPRLRVRMCGKLLLDRGAQEGPGRLPHSDRRLLNGDRSHLFPARAGLVFYSAGDPEQAGRLADTAGRAPRSTPSKTPPRRTSTPSPGRVRPLCGAETLAHSTTACQAGDSARSERTLQ